MNRREFFKGSIGLGGALLAGEVSAGDIAGGRNGKKTVKEHPWWVKEIDRPAMKIDDSRYGRFDPRKNVFGSQMKYIGREKFIKLKRERREKIIRYLKEKKPGYRLEDRALSTAGWTLTRTGGVNKGMRSWTSPYGTSPKEYGREVEKFQGTPEEAALIVKRAARYFGAATVGIARLDRRHIFSKEYSFEETENGYREVEYEIVFEDVDEPYSTEDKLVIPNKCQYVIALSIQMSLDNIKCTPSAIEMAGASLGYSRAEFLVGALAEFIRALGYVAIPSVNDLGSSIAFAVDAGLGELGRSNRLVTPEFGPNVRLAKVITDLPMAIDKPISFGLKEFCKVCKLCAEHCPSGALSFEDEPSFKVRGEWNNPGHEAWFETAPNCLMYWDKTTTGCAMCITVCPWTKKDIALIHDIVKASSAKIPALDEFFVTMDGLFGYGKTRDPGKWWNLELPEYGIRPVEE